MKLITVDKLQTKETTRMMMSKNSTAVWLIKTYFNLNIKLSRTGLNMDMLSILSVIVKANGMDLSVRDGQIVAS